MLPWLLVGCEGSVAASCCGAGTKEVAAPPEKDARCGCREEVAGVVEVVSVVEAIQSSTGVQREN